MKIYITQNNKPEIEIMLSLFNVTFVLSRKFGK